MKVFSILGYPFIKLWKLINGNAGESFAKRIQQIAIAALPIVEMIAAMTPTRVDDELVALFKKYAVPGVEYYLSLPMEKRGIALSEVAVTELAQKFPGTPTYLLKLAVEQAVAKYKLEAAA